MIFVAQAWRNWQTRTVQVRVLARAWRFKSSCLHHKESVPFRVLIFYAEEDLNRPKGKSSCLFCVALAAVQNRTAK